MWKLGEGKWGRKKCRRIPKCEGHWQGRVPKRSLHPKTLQNKRFGAPNFLGISPKLFAALRGIHPYLRTPVLPRVQGRWARQHPMSCRCRSLLQANTRFLNTWAFLFFRYTPEAAVSANIRLQAQCQSWAHAQGGVRQHSVLRRVLRTFWEGFWGRGSQKGSEKGA